MCYLALWFVGGAVRRLVLVQCLGVAPERGVSRYWGRRSWNRDTAVAWVGCVAVVGPGVLDSRHG